MGRKVMRVPAGFDWPMDKVWQGYLLPEWLREHECPDCENGYSPRGRQLLDLWYGYAPFRPEDTGSTPLTPETPAVRRLAERNVSHSPDFYGAAEAAILREAQRLCDLWNGQWCHHLGDDDVAALVDAGRLMDLTHTWSRGTGWQPIDPPPVLTAVQVNEWSLHGMGHDSINAGIVVRARCEREGVSDTCPTCQGYATVEAFKGQRAVAEAWQGIEPPTGDGWQLWETVSEGSPISPVFATAEELAEWMVANREASDLEVARRFVAAGWAPSLIGSDAAGVVTGRRVRRRQP